MKSTPLLARITRYINTIIALPREIRFGRNFKMRASRYIDLQGIRPDNPAILLPVRPVLDSRPVGLDRHIRGSSIPNKFSECGRS